jgi:hypothetical protein
MSKYRFVKAATERHDLSDGDWCEFKRLLTIGEKLKIDSSGFSHVARGDSGGEQQEVRVNWREMKIVRMLTWLADWSFMTEDGKKRKALSRENIEGLTEEAFGELERALDTHIEAMELERRGPSGENAPATIA